MSSCACTRLNKNERTNGEGFHELEFVINVLNRLVVAFMLNFKFSELQALQLCLQMPQRTLLFLQTQLNLFQSLTTTISSVYDLQLATNLILELFSDALALRVVHAVELLLFQPEVFKGLLEFLAEVVLVFDFSFGYVAILFFLHEQLVYLYPVPDAGNLFLECLLIGIVADDRIDVVDPICRILKLRLKLFEKVIVLYSVLWLLVLYLILQVLVETDFVAGELQLVVEGDGAKLVSAWVVIVGVERIVESLGGLIYTLFQISQLLLFICQFNQIQIKS